MNMVVSSRSEVIPHLTMQTDYGVLTVSKKTDQTYHLRAISWFLFAMLSGKIRIAENLIKSHNCFIKWNIKIQWNKDSSSLEAFAEQAAVFFWLSGMFWIS